MKHLLLLIGGIAITILYIVFASQIYELMYYEQAFSDWMYNQNMYFVVAIVTTLVAWILPVIYYYVINSARFCRWYHWLIMLIIATILSPTVSVAYSNGAMDDGIDYSVQLQNFSIVNLAVTIVLFIIASFSIRWWSSQCKHTPIPQ
jgi:hypothetical protein